MTAIQLTGDHFHLSDRIRAHAADKLASLDRYLGDLQRCDATIHRMPGQSWRIDATLHRTRGHHIAVHAVADSVYAAINRLADRARAQCHKIHDREVDRQHA